MTGLPRIPGFLLLLAAALLPLGCSTYKLGAPATLPFASIHIPPAGNDSFAPQAQALVSAQVREFFIRDGRVRLVSDPEAADATLWIKLTDFQREADARDPADTVRAETFRLDLQARVSLVDNRNGEAFFRGRELSANAQAYATDPYRQAGELPVQDLNQSAYNTMPVLTRDLARRIADEVLGAW